MKNITQKIDRATLLKTGGTAAVASLLMGTSKGRADACCSPIDLTYTDDPQVAAVSHRRKAATPVKGLIMRKEGYKVPDSSWTLIYTIPNAHVEGDDEDGKPHGANGHSKALGYNISVYVK